MNSLNSVRTLLKDYLEEASSYRSEYENLPRMLVKKDFSQKVYDAFFNLIADPTHSPESIIHIINTYTGGLEGFSKNKCIQTLVGFACLEGLARRRPAVLNGPWEILTWIIVKYTSFANTALGNCGINEIYSFMKPNITTLELITEFGSAEFCPNPCLRLELFRFIKSFNYNELDGDLETYRDKVINTLLELGDNFTFLTVNQVPNVSPIDLYFVMKDNYLNIGFITNAYDLDIKKSEIIAAVLKLTKNLALLEKEKYQRLNNQANEDECLIFNKQMSACLSFCGLLPLLSDHSLNIPGGTQYHDECLLYLVQAVGNDSLLLNYVIDSLDTITQVSLCFPNNRDLQALVFHRKEKLLHTFFKGHINQLPTLQYMREIYGGFSQAKEYQLRYFQSDLRHLHNDSDYNSECSDSEENVSGENDSEENDSEENDSEIDISD